MPRETALPEPQPTPPARRRRWPWVAAAVIAVPVVAGAVFLASFDLNDQKPRIQALVKERTGRDLTLAGPIGIKLSLVPTITAEDVALSNMPTGSRPEKHLASSPSRRLLPQSNGQTLQLSSIFSRARTLSSSPPDSYKDK